tara:strand:- start:2563 stop:3321 length:759 start_codon:yes stop_codon:yes gene_type:complete
LANFKPLSFFVGFVGFFLFLSCNNSESKILNDSAQQIVYQIPFTSNEQHRYKINNSEEDEIALGVLSSYIEDGHLVLEQKYLSLKDETATDEIVLVVDPQTLKPLAGLREISHANPDGKQVNDVYEWVYDSNLDFPKLDSTVTTQNGIKNQSLELIGNYFDNESSFWLWRTLEFFDGGEFSYNTSIVLSNENNSMSVRIFPEESVRVPAGTYNAWRLVIRNGRALASAWINTLPPHEMVRYDNGDIVLQLSD